MSDEGKTQDYFQEWYEKNRTLLNARRRRRYAEDVEYRAKVQEWNRVARERRRADVIREDREVRGAVKVRMVNTWKTVEMEVEGVKVPMFTIGALARATGKSISTIRMWEKNGVLPETQYKTKKGDRLYTYEMVQAVRVSLQKVGKLGPGAGNLLQEKKKPIYVVRRIRFDSGHIIRMRLYKIGTLAKAVGRTVVALVLMEQRRVLPKTPLVASSLKYRLYTLDMIEVVQAAFNRRGGCVRGALEWDDFYDEVMRGWMKLGVMNARLDDEDESGEGSSGRT